jgi:hypothetical protein
VRYVVAVIGVAVLLAALAARAGLFGRMAGRRPGSGDRRLEQLTKEELYGLAQEAGIAGRSGMSKDELIRALRAR